MDTLGFNSGANSLASAYSASTPLAEAPPLPAAPAATSPTSAAAPTCACCQQWDNAKKDPILNQLSAVLRTEWAPAKPAASPAPKPAETSPATTRSSPPPAAQASAQQDPEEVARIKTLVAAAYEKATAQPGQALDPTLDPSEKFDDDAFVNLSGLLDGTQARKRRENETPQGPDTISVV